MVDTKKRVYHLYCETENHQCWWFFSYTIIKGNNCSFVAIVSFGFLSQFRNDIASEIKTLAPKAELYEEYSDVNILGTECRVGHHVTNMTFDKKLTFYGHSIAYDRWKYSFNSQGFPCRFNSMWGSFVTFLIPTNSSDSSLERKSKIKNYL